MAKAKTNYTCSDCGGVSTKWTGQCSACQQWNTMIETVVEAPGLNRLSNQQHKSLAQTAPVLSLADIEAVDVPRFGTGIEEFDRVLGGGLVSGGVVLIGGDPGIGKSTLLLQALANIAHVKSTLYVSGEESGAQIALRARRLGIDARDLKLQAEIQLEKILGTLADLKPEVAVIDSIQTVYSDALTSAPGSVSQVRECAAQLTRVAKQTGITIILVGHVTKEGALAGPRVLEHIVDTVLYFEGDTQSSFRLVRAIKNRFGAVNELGVFAMTEKGLKGVSNPSALFLSQHDKQVPGSCVMVTQEGTRPLLVEIQALGIVHKMKEVFNLHSISEWLPYQYFNPETEIFEMEHAQGVMLEATPMVGASDDNAEALYSLLQRILPEGAIVQFLLYASPHLGSELDAYIQERKGNHALLEKKAEHRVNYLKKGAHNTLIPGQQAVLRDYRLLITLVFDNQLGLSESKIMSLRHSLLGTLKGMGVSAKILGPDEMMTWVDCLLRPNSKLYPQKFRWNELQCIASQLAAPHQSHFLTSQRIGVNEGEWEIRNYRVSEFPTEPVHLYEMADLIGSQFDNNTRIGCPFSLSLIIKIGNQKEEKRVAQIRAPRAAQRAAMIGKFSPKAIEDAQEAREIVKQLENFERLVVVDFQATLHYQKGTGDIHETNLMNVFQGGSKKWLLVRNNMLQMVSLIAHLPLAQSHLSFKEMHSLGMTQKIWAMNAANMAPIIAEMKGMDSHRLMISGRRGQVLYWDPFGNQRGNYNTCVAGISGSGKSFTVQEIAASLVATGARVWIIDVGRSYKKLCNIIGGQFVEFNKEAKICLNPFSTVISEEIDEFYAFMTPLISLMAKPDKQASSLEVSFIEQAVKAVWVEKEWNGGIGDVAIRLLNHSDPRANDLGASLYSYTPEGQYGSYFNGVANINFDSPMVVFELEEINGNKRLQSVIFMLLMYHVTEKMYLGGRQTQMALIIDEAWDMLKGGHGGDIIESISRRARKYKGCLITITQSISDYFASPAGRAAYNNSYWRILHAQNKTNISNLIENKQLSLDPFQERLLRSVTTEHGQYSEMMIQGDSGEYAVGRLLLDPYSRILYSTQAQDYAAVNQLCSEGIPLEQAIGFVAERVFSNEYI